MVKKMMIGVIAGLALSFSFYIGTVSDPYKDAVISEGALVQVLDELLENHYSDPLYEDLIEGAINGAIDALDDPYTSYFDYEEALQYQTGFDESYVGIGVSVSMYDNKVVIEQVFEDSPAEGAGIEVNDIIVSVDEYDMTDISLYELVGYVLGPEGEDVTIGVVRAGFDEVIRLTMTRASISRATVEYESFVRDSQLVGYIKVNTFGDETAALFSQAIIELELEGIDSLVVDLRDNGGGHLSTVVNMLNQFLVDDDTPMFSTEYYISGTLRTSNYYASSSSFRDYNIVTLVNENSASASEVFVTSMAEHGDYTTFGTTTFGKGTMQSDVSINASVGDALHITIGKWFTSDDTWVHYDGGTNGFTPSNVVERDEILSAFKVFLEGDNILEYDTVNYLTENVQVILNMMGYTVRTDGYFGHATKDAILDIQATNSLPETGNINNETLNIINDALAEYKDDINNDNQLQAAIDYLVLNPLRD